MKDVIKTNSIALHERQTAIVGVAALALSHKKAANGSIGKHVLSVLTSNASMEPAEALELTDLTRGELLQLLLLLLMLLHVQCEYVARQGA
jgi:hypothetical protein